MGVVVLLLHCLLTSFFLLCPLCFALPSLVLFPSVPHVSLFLCSCFLVFLGLSWSHPPPSRPHALTVPSSSCGSLLQPSYHGPLCSSSRPSRSTTSSPPALTARCPSHRPPSLPSRRPLRRTGHRSCLGSSSSSAKANIRPSPIETRIKGPKSCVPRQWHF